MFLLTNTTDHRVGVSIPPSAFIMVDFPQPECPMMDIISPFLIERLMSFTAVYFPFGVGK